MEKIIINKLDYIRLKQWISNAKLTKSVSNAEAEKLLIELENAKIIEPEKIPSNVVTMNSIVNDAKKADIKPPAVIVIGEVVKLSRKLKWFKPSQP